MHKMIIQIHLIHVVINSVLKDSPKIDQIKEQLKVMIREELKIFKNKE